MQNMIKALLLMLGWVISLQAQPFPSAGYDVFSSQGVFQVTLHPAFGGMSRTITVNDPNTYVLRSSVHLDGDNTDLTGAIVGDGTMPGPVVNDPDTVSDADIDFHPAGFNTIPGRREIHTKIAWMEMTGQGWTVRAGDAAPNRPHSLGEVEAGFPAPVVAPDFPARSFFNLFVEVETPPDFGGMKLITFKPFTVIAQPIFDFPPIASSYMHTFSVADSQVVELYDSTGCILVGWLMKGAHGVNRILPPSIFLSAIPTTRLPYPTVFSVDSLAEGIICLMPNDVFSLGTAGGWGGAPGLSTTQGELFQSPYISMMPPVGPVPSSNFLRISGALGTGTQLDPLPPNPPPYTGPISPPPGPPGAPVGSPIGTMGLQEGDDIISLSFGEDGGDVLLFSVDPAAMGKPGTAVRFQATSTLARPIVPAIAPVNWGGDPGHEAAGDIFISQRLMIPFGAGPPGIIIPGAAPAGSNILGTDELLLGLQAPATAGSFLGAPEDNLDALELTDAAVVDANGDGIVDAGKFVYFSLHPASPSINANATADDILVTAGAGFAFAIYADGVANIGLLPGDVIDALVLFDAPPSGVLNPGVDQALFSLAAGSPSLAAWPGGFPGNVYLTDFMINPPSLYMSADDLGLEAGDELDALDIGFNCDDPDNDGWCNTSIPGFPGFPIDNCPGIPNHDQKDFNWNGIGDACEPGLKPDIAVYPPCMLCFGSVPVGSSDTLTLVVYNEGPITLENLQFMITGPNASEFSLGNTQLPDTISPVVPFYLKVVFTPTSANPKRATLTISSNDPDENPLIIGLGGWWPSSCPAEIAVSPASISETLFVGQSATDSLSIANLGIDCLNWSISENPPVPWLSVNPASNTARASETDKVFVLFDATGLAAGNYNTNIVVASNDPINPTVIVQAHLLVVTCTPGLLGDVTGDNAVNSLDALIMLSFDAGLPLPQPFLDRIAIGFGDVTEDGFTNSTDALVTLSWEVGFPVPFPVGTVVCLPTAAKRNSGKVGAVSPSENLSIQAYASLNRTGQTLEVPVMVDMLSTNEKLGSYTMTMRWNPALLEFTGFSGGNTEGFVNPVVNDLKVKEGRLTAAHAYPNGAAGLVNILNARFTVKGNLEALPNNSVSLSFSAMAAAETFANLLPALKVVNDPAANEIPKSFALEHYPNPFNPATEIRYQLPEAVAVRITVYNVLGQEVQTLVRSRQEAGSYVIRWEGTNEQGQPVPSGMYFLRMSAGKFIADRKLLLLK